MDPSRYKSVDVLQAETTLQEAAAKCGTTIEVHGTGRQVRIDCPFNCSGDHAGKHEISVDTSNPQKVFACHAYTCQVRGNLLALMHGWLTGTRPTGDKLKGEEFKHVRNVLAGVLATPPSGVPQVTDEKKTEQKAAEQRNTPLANSENEKARELVTLDDKFLRDVAHMPPAAASYVRRHPCLSAAVMEKWRVGVLPQDGGADKRGWALRGQLLYPILGVDGKLLAWVARDPQFDSKEQTFNALHPEERAKEKKPAKHRFPSDFLRRLELFGQHSSRLEEPGYRETIARYGIIVVEGFNDVLGLDALGVPAVGIMSNKITEEQVAKIVRFAKNLSNGKVTLMFDVNDAGEAGAKEALWFFAQHGIDVRLAWSKEMHGEKFADREPESIVADEWEKIIRPAITRLS